MKEREYDLIVIGTGSAMEIVNTIIQDNPKVKIAVIDKDEPGGICLTGGCILSKILLYPAELIRTIERTCEFGIFYEINFLILKRSWRECDPIFNQKFRSLCLCFAVLQG